MVQAAPDAMGPDQSSGRTLSGKGSLPLREGRGREPGRKEGSYPAFVNRREPWLLLPLLTGPLPCRPHAVDTGARAAVAGVGDKGVWLDGDRHVLLPEHGWQGTVQNEQGGLPPSHLPLQHRSAVVTPQLPQGK